MDRIISGIKPTGELTLGNLLGAINKFIKLQDNYELFAFIADLHALTAYNDPKVLKNNIKNLIATYIAAGLDPNKVILFKQSDIPAHNQLEWILTCNTNLADLTKMPQYKNYIAMHKNEQVPSGMLLYPSLMNADILLYDAKYVPVGLDQKPHIDLTRDIAEIFNKRYGETFVLPEAIISETGAKILSLTDPTKKMSKSESEKGTIFIFDSADNVRSKIKKATTDSEFKIYYDPKNKPGISNLLAIQSCITETSIKDLESYYANESNYGVFKKDVAESLCIYLLNLQEKITFVKNNYDLNKILVLGKEKAETIANNKISEVYKKVGLA